MLSAQFGQCNGANVLELLGKATGRKKNGLSEVTVRDAFVMAIIAAILRHVQVPLSEEEMELCAGILVMLLPVDRLAQAGMADQKLRTLTRDKSLVRKIQRICGQMR